MSERLKELYYNTKTGFLSSNKLWQKAKEEGIPVSLNDVKRFLEQQKPYELTKQVKKPQNFPMCMPIIHYNVFNSISWYMIDFNFINTNMFLVSLMCIQGLSHVVH